MGCTMGVVLRITFEAVNAQHSICHMLFGACAEAAAGTHSSVSFLLLGRCTADCNTMSRCHVLSRVGSL